MSITRGHLFAALITALVCHGMAPTLGVAESIYLEEFPDPENAMISNQIVAIRAQGLEFCPKPYLGDWQISQALDDIGGVQSPDSSPVCFYQGEDVSQIDALVNDGLLVRYGMNMAAVVGAGTEVLKPKIWRPLLAHFESQAGKVPLTLIPGTPKVRLAVIDTVPTQDQKPWQVPGRSGHGHSLINMAKNLLCSTPAGDCISHLTSRLALTYYVDPIDPTIIRNDPIGGGEFGGFVELAQAINREVAAWVDEAPDSRLILNLSIGWDGRFGGLQNQPSKMPAAIEMVYKAITDAACRGALIITAAGNDVGGPATGDAWLPAQWGNRTRPDQATCEAKLGTSLDPTIFPSGLNVPLLYRFSGLRWDGEPLSNAIPGTESQLTFYADHAVAEYPADTPTKILTGSSVSALVASATAAAVSYYWPDPPYPKIMESIYHAGTDMGRQAELCQGIDCPDSNMGPQVHLGNVCSALTALCSTVSIECPSLPPCDPLGSEAPGISFQQLYDDFSVLTPPSLNARDLTGGHVPPSLCDVDEQNFRLDLGIPANPCPERQRFSALIRPWVREGPGDVPCPSCAFERIGGGGFGRLLIEIGTSWTEPLTEPTLVACGNSYRLPLLSGAPLNGGDRMIVENVGVPWPCPGPMKLTFTVRGQLSSTDPILVLP